MEERNIIINKLKSIFNSVGIYITNENYKDKIVIDSLQFINIIIAIEEIFKINISNEFIEFDKLLTFDDYITLVINKHLNNLN